MDYCSTIGVRPQWYHFVLIDAKRNDPFASRLFFVGFGILVICPLAFVATEETKYYCADKKQDNKYLSRNIRVQQVRVTYGCNQAATRSNHTEETDIVDGLFC